MSLWESPISCIRNKVYFTWMIGYEHLRQRLRLCHIVQSFLSPCLVTSKLYYVKICWFKSQSRASFPIHFFQQLVDLDIAGFAVLPPFPPRQMTKGKWWMVAQLLINAACLSAFSDLDFHRSCWLMWCYLPDSEGLPVSNIQGETCEAVSMAEMSCWGRLTAYGELCTLGMLPIFWSQVYGWGNFSILLQIFIFNCLQFL